jgi:hypothetical protein
MLVTGKENTIAGINDLYESSMSVECGDIHTQTDNALEGS